MDDDAPRRRWADRLGTEYLAVEVLVERLKRLEQAIASETALRDRALEEYKALLKEKMEQLNHLREEVLRERAELASKAWTEAQFTLVENRFRGVDRTLYAAIGGVAVIAGLIEIVLKVWGR